MTKESKPILVAEILKCDSVLPSGHVYPKDVIEKSIAALNDRLKKGEKILGYMVDNRDRFGDNIFEASHELKMVEIKDDGAVIGELELYDTPKGKIVQDMLNECDFADNNRKSSLKPVVSGFGEIGPNNKVTTFNIMGVDVEICDHEPEPWGPKIISYDPKNNN